jgi:hypothetical protein
MSSRAIDVVMRLLVALAAAALLLALWHRPAWSACAYYGMAPNVTYGITNDPTIIRFHPARVSWMTMATRPFQSTEDWDLGLYRDTAAEPACVATLLANSSVGGSLVDFVLGDYTHNAFTDVYARFARYSGTDYTFAQWRDTALALVPQGPFANRTWTSTDLIEVWNVPLVAGAAYTLSFSHDATIDAKLMVFRNSGGASYWVGRSSALLAASGTATYTAPQTGDYAFVVVNDNGGSGTFWLGVGRCQAPTVLASGASVWTSDAYHDWSFTPTSAFWGAIGVLSTDADYDLAAYGGTAGLGYPDCLSGNLGGSSDVGVVDYMVGDFNHTPWATAYAHSLLWSGAPGARVLWQLGNAVLLVNAAPVTAAFSAGTFLRTWDVLLTAGTTYHFVFEPSGAPLRLQLFRNAGGGAYYAGRGSAVLDAGDCVSYTAPATDFYGLVVVDDTGADATCRLGVNASPCACPKPLASGVPAATASPDDYFEFTQDYNYWAVAAVRGTSTADDWDVVVGGLPTGSPAPDCIGGPLGASSQVAGVVDFVTIDFNSTALQPLYVHASHYSGPGASGLAEWLGTTDALVANGPLVGGLLGASDLAHVYDAFMTATWPYRIEFGPGPGQRLFVFENSSGGTFVSYRAAAAISSTGGQFTYTPTRTGFHALVVVNDNGTTGEYQLGYGICRNPTVLSSGVAVTPAFGYSDFQFGQADPNWAAIGVRPHGVDWDIETASGLTGPFPNCLGPILAASMFSSTSMVDIVIGDFHHTSTGTYYAEANQYTPGAFVPATVEWDGGANAIVGNDNNIITRTTGPADVLECWDLYMSAGLTYTFYFSHSGGANLHLLLFRNPGGGTYWAGRNSAVLDLPVSAGSTFYTAPASDDYAVVVVNDDGTPDTYHLQVNFCFGPTALLSGTPYLTDPGTFKSFAQTADYWTAVGVRGSSDWDIGVYENPTGGVPGVCLDLPLAFSLQVGVADLVVGDFNTGANAPGTYYVHAWRAGGTSTGTLEWDDGSDLLTLNAPPVHRTTGPTDVLECWDVGLGAGSTYGIYFTHTGAADLKLLLFRNPGSTYWAPRSSRVLETSTHVAYAAPATDYYGLVVVNDNGEAGAYDLAVYTGGVGVEGGAPPAVTALRAVSPNPARSAFSLEYALHAPGNVRIELLDLAGRSVGALEEGRRDAGVWRATWPEDRRTPPGVYLIRLVVDGRTIGQRKAAILR